MQEAIDGPDRGQRLIKKSRNLGASWFTLLLYDWYSRFHDNKSFLVASRDEELVDKTGDPKSLFWKLDFIHDYLPGWLQVGPGGETRNRTIGHIDMPWTGSVIDGVSTNKHLGRGDRRTAILLDENAAMPNGHQINSAISATAHIVFKVSTPEHSLTSFAQDEKLLLDGGESWKIKYLHWSLHPIFNRGLYAVDDWGNVEYLDKDYWTTEKIMSDKVVRQRPKGKKYNLRSPWYDNDIKGKAPQDVARNYDLDDEGTQSLFYDQAEIMRLQLFCKPPQYTGRLIYDLDDGKPVRWEGIEDQRVRFDLWCELRMDQPLRDRRYGIGADVAGGVGRTPSVATVIDFSTHEKVARIYTRYLPADKFAILCAALGRWFLDADGGEAEIVAEAAGPGGQFLKTLVGLNYSRLWRRKIKTSAGYEDAPEVGYPINSASNKRMLHETYRTSLSNGTFINFDAPALAETLEYIVMPDGLAVDHISSRTTDADPAISKINHGDMCVADALANILVNFDYKTSVKGEEQESPASQYPLYSMGWNREQRALEESRNQYA